MRYRLRTLLIVVTVLAAVLARIAYLKRQRDFHRREVNRVVTQLATFHHYGGREIERRVSEIAAKEGPNTRGIAIYADMPWEYSSSEYDDMFTNWHLARQHQILANRYNQAIYCPWELVWDDPNSVPDKVRWMDLRVAGYSIVLALAIVAAWRLLPQIIAVLRTRSNDQKA
jgi:hypothetical protein